MRRPLPTRRACLLAAALGAGFLLEPLGRAFALATLAADALLLLLFLADGRLARRQRFEVRRRLPPRLRLDGPVQVHVEVRNLGPWTAEFLFSDDLCEALEGEFAPGPHAVLPGRTALLECAVVPRSRGEHRLGEIRLRARGPLGLAWREERFDPEDKVRVYPDWGILSTWERLLVRGRSRAVGLRPSRDLGQGTEFESLRDWQPGDDPRHIDWKVSVRRGRLSFRNREFERQQNVLLLLDTGRTARARWKERERLEVSLQAAGLLAWVAVRHHDNVGAVCFSSRVHGVVPPTTGPAAVGRVREVLLRARADLEEPDYREAFALARALLPKRSLLLLFADPAGTSMSEEIRRQFVESAKRHVGCLVTMRDPELWRIAAAPARSPEGLCSRASAEALIQERARAIQALRARGIGVVDAFPEEVTGGVVGRYLEIKARGAL
ncbi:MAG TPA: DUF58 domain-containing protein [Planctomycetota bacterium]|nr:DUF58 domain-containing protein [Planctomycetota bacterium]